jgi:hypothetical protein
MSNIKRSWWFSREASIRAHRWHRTRKWSMKMTWDFMCRMFWFVLLVAHRTINGFVVYHNANLILPSNEFIFANMSPVNSLLDCACTCSATPMCITATYSEIQQRCVLSSARLNQSVLILVKIDRKTSVLSFLDKILPSKWLRYIINQEWHVKNDPRVEYDYFRGCEVVR